MNTITPKELLIWCLWCLAMTVALVAIYFTIMLVTDAADPAWYAKAVLWLSWAFAGIGILLGGAAAVSKVIQVGVRSANE